MNGLIVRCRSSLPHSQQPLLLTNVLLWAVWPLYSSVMDHQRREKSASHSNKEIKQSFSPDCLSQPVTVLFI